ncbi:uncharacterized protein METZ01_LOCUS18926 [marine metagenome]|uniref:Uncharacterized protein n=1 Tax=marine metagenome TaxID=408172 RepID=A0A381PGG3_9ZZZZ
MRRWAVAIRVESSNQAVFGCPGPSAPDVEFATSYTISVRSILTKSSSPREALSDCPYSAMDPRWRRSEWQPGVPHRSPIG